MLFNLSPTIPPIAFAQDVTCSTLVAKETLVLGCSMEITSDTETKQLTMKQHVSQDLDAVKDFLRIGLWK